MKIELSELAEVKGIGKKTIERIRKYKLADDGYISEYDEGLHLDRNSVNQGDCLELMNGIPDKSVDMILADLPYGTTACNWDSIIGLDKLWLQYERIIKDNGAIVLTASQPFTSKLIMSNIKLYRYNWIWKKHKASNFMLAKKQPLKNHEDICVFYKKQPTYNPQLTELTEQGKKRNNRSQSGNKMNKTDTVFGDVTNLNVHNYKGKTHGYPKTIVKFNGVVNNQFSKKLMHPTQKPVELFEYLIKTYTNKRGLVLDNVAGSGTTGVACKNTNRDYILIEQEDEYINIINDRLGANN